MTAHKIILTTLRSELDLEDDLHRASNLCWGAIGAVEHALDQGGIADNASAKGAIEVLYVLLRQVEAIEANFAAVKPSNC